MWQFDQKPICLLGWIYTNMNWIYTTFETITWYKIHDNWLLPSETPFAYNFKYSLRLQSEWEERDTRRGGLNHPNFLVTNHPTERMFLMYQVSTWISRSDQAATPPAIAHHQIKYIENTFWKCYQIVERWLCTLCTPYILINLETCDHFKIVNVIVIGNGNGK